MDEAEDLPDGAMDVPALLRLLRTEGGPPVAGPVQPQARLVDIGLDGLDLLVCIGLIEARYGIEFPADLLPALETVDDLLHYTAVKRSQL